MTQFASNIELDTDYNKENDRLFMNTMPSRAEKQPSKRKFLIEEESMDPYDYALKKLRMTKSQFERYNHAFSLLDLSDTGNVSKLEFEKVIGFFGLANNLSQEDLNQLFSKLDNDSDGQFNLHDFLREINNPNSFKMMVRLVKSLIERADQINEYRNELGKPNKIQIMPGNVEKQESKETSQKDDKSVEETSEIEPIAPSESFEAKRERLERAAMEYTQHSLHMKTDQYDKIVRAFRRLDSKDQGFITKMDFYESLPMYSLMEDLQIKDFDDIFKELDKDRDGEISLRDFLESVNQGISGPMFNHVVNTILHHEDPSLKLSRREELPKPPAPTPLEEQTEQTSKEEVQETLIPTDETKLPPGDEIQKFQEGEENIPKSPLPSPIEMRAKEEEWDISEEIKERSHSVVTPLHQEDKTPRLQRREDLPKPPIITPLTDQAEQISREEPIENLQPHHSIPKRAPVSFRNKDLTVVNDYIQKIKGLEAEFNEIAALKKVIDYKDKIISEKNSIIEELDSKNYELMSTGANRDFQNEILIEEENIKLRNIIQDLELERAKLYANLSEAKRNIDIIHKDEDRHRRQTEELWSQVQHSVNIESHRVVLKERDTLLHENIALRGELELLRNSNNLLRQEREALELKASDLEAERAHLHETCNTVNQDLKTIIKDIEEFERREKDYLEQIEVLNKKLEHTNILERELNALRRENDHLKFQVTTLNQRNQQQGAGHQSFTLMREFEDMKKELENFRQKEKEYERDMSTLSNKHEIELLIQKMDALETENNQLKEKLNEDNALIQKIDALETENNHLKEKPSENDILIQKMDALETENNQLQEKLNEDNALIQELDALETENNHLKEKPSENDILIQKMDALETENNHLKERLQQLLNEKEQNQGSSEFIDQLSQVENSLKNLQQRESNYTRQIEALSKEIETYTLDAEKLRIDNSFLQDQISTINEEMEHIRKENSQIHDINKRLNQELNMLQGQLNKLADEKSKYLQEFQTAAYNENKSLREAYEKLKTENQNFKVKNLMLQDRIDALGKERARMGDKENQGQFAQEIASLTQERKDLRRENQTLRQQIDELRNQHSRLGPLREIQNYTPTKVETLRSQREKDVFKSPSQKTYLEAVEKLKDELRNVRESREAILSSLEKERHAIREAIDEMPNLGTRGYFSAKKTPIKKDFDIGTKASTIERPSGEVEHGSTARKRDFNELINQSAPETIKKVTSRPIQTFVAYTSHSAHKEDTMRHDREHATHPKTEAPEGYDQRIRDTSRFAFQILYWITDNALITKELSSLSPIIQDDQVTNEIRQIMKDMHTFSEQAKAYYNKHISDKTNDDVKAVYEFILPLFSECYKSHNQLKEIQNRIVANLKEVVNSSNIGTES